jgi:hypothetical protein
MLLTELEFLCTGFKCLLHGWNAFDRVGIPLYRVEMLSRVLACFRQSWNTFAQVWNAFSRVVILLYRDEIHSRGVECFLEGRNAFYRVGIPLYRV